METSIGPSVYTLLNSFCPFRYVIRGWFFLFSLTIPSVDVMESIIILDPVECLVAY